MHAEVRYSTQAWSSVSADKESIQDLDSLHPKRFFSPEMAIILHRSFAVTFLLL